MTTKNAAAFALLLCVLLCNAFYQVRAVQPLTAEPAMSLTHRKLLWGGYYDWFNSHRGDNGQFDCSPSNSAAAASAAAASGASAAAASSASASSACQGYANGGGNGYNDYNEGCESCYG